MMKHAPGKWTVNKYDNGFSIYAGHFRCVAERFEVNPSPERLAMHIANATLMAEAPVLLAACEAAHDDLICWQQWCKSVESVDMSDAGYVESPNEIVLEQLRTVIAKAKGESHART